ncbi:hypothetical protein SDC9_55932 [bioreactor metagenome]|uniref:Outer membrane protein beta-barrel domain-containing protein n=1 Tax=bioreactor metagenome TaxID=1076179 RepID=A0A644X151_9ZZZZ
MKKSFLIFVVALFSLISKAQVNTYTTTGVEMKLTGVQLEDTQNPNQIPRFTLWYNFTEYFHFDVAKSFGFFTGIGIENVGFIADYNDSMRTKIKFRSYMATMPLGIKIGNFDKQDPMFFFAGGAISVPFHYKEKVFFNDKKDNVFHEWFSSRTNFLQPSAFAGFTFPNKMSLKVEYFFENFMNRGFTENTGGVDIKSYEHIVQSNIIAVTLSSSFTNVKKKK